MSMRKRKGQCTQAASEEKRKKNQQKRVGRHQKKIKKKQNGRFRSLPARRKRKKPPEKESGRRLPRDSVGRRGTCRRDRWIDFITRGTEIEGTCALRKKGKKEGTFARGGRAIEVSGRGLLRARGERPGEKGAKYSMGRCPRPPTKTGLPF